MCGVFSRPGPSSCLPEVSIKNPVLLHIKQVCGVFHCTKGNNSSRILIMFSLFLNKPHALVWNDPPIKKWASKELGFVWVGEEGPCARCAPSAECVTSRCGILSNSLGSRPWNQPPCFLQRAGKIANAKFVSPWHSGVSQDIDSEGIPDRVPLFISKLCQELISCCGMSPLLWGMLLTIIDFHAVLVTLKEKKTPRFLMVLIILWERSD